MRSSPAENSGAAPGQAARPRQRLLWSAAAALAVIAGAVGLGGWLGALVALWVGPAFAAFDHGHDRLRELVGTAVGALSGLVVGVIALLHATGRPGRF